MSSSVELDRIMNNVNFYDVNIDKINEQEHNTEYFSWKNNSSSTFSASHTNRLSE